MINFTDINFHTNPYDFFLSDRNVNNLYLTKIHTSKWFCNLIYNKFIYATQNKISLEAIFELLKLQSDGELDDYVIAYLTNMYNFIFQSVPDIFPRGTIDFDKAGQATIDFLEYLKNLPPGKGPGGIELPINIEDMLTHEEKEKENREFQKLFGGTKMKDVFNKKINLTILDKISLTLKGESKFEVEDIKSIPKENIAGKDFLIRRMKEIAEIEDVPEDILLESDIIPQSLEMDLIENKLLVQKRAKRIKQKQQIYLLLDISGSMRLDFKLSIAAAIIYNRIKAVMEDKCDLYIVPFSDTLSQEIHVTKDIAEEYINNISLSLFSGGGTSIQHCICLLAKEMQNLPITSKPEMILVSDGQEKVDYFKLTTCLSKIKFHAFMLLSRNLDIKQLAKTQNGVYFNFNYNGDVMEDV